MAKIQKTFKNKRKHISSEERFCIEKMLKQDKFLKEIAETLGRGLSTISMEVEKNGGRDAYDAKKAEKRAHLKQYWKKKECNKVAMNSELYRFVEKALSKGWSPELISERIKEGKNLKSVSGKSIRKFIHRRSGLERFLFWERNKVKSGRKRGKGKYLHDPERKWIDTRPYTALYEYGHWEMDFIVSKHNSSVLLVLVERYSKKLLLKVLPNRNNDLINTEIKNLLTGYTVTTITTDNDIAFAKWRELETMLDAEIYFCHPYHSWEKGLVENTNRWIRTFIPKKTNLQLISSSELKAIEDWFNHTPKLCLEGRTAYEVVTEKEYGTLVESLSINLPIIRIWG